MTNPSADLNAMSPEERSSMVGYCHESEIGNPNARSPRYKTASIAHAALKAADERAGELRALRWVQGYTVSRGIGGMSTALEHRIYELEKEATNG